MKLRNFHFDTRTHFSFPWGGIISTSDIPKRYKTSGIKVAAFVGGGFPTAYLVHHNLRESGRTEEAKEALVVFGTLGVAFLLVAARTPPDIISMLLGVGIPEFLLVLALMRFTRMGKLAGHSSNEGASRSNWHAWLIAMASNLLIALTFGFIYALGILIQKLGA